MLRHRDIAVHAAACQILTLRLDLPDARLLGLSVHLDRALVLPVVLNVKLREDAADTLRIIAAHLIRADASRPIELIGTGKRHSWRINVQAEVLRRVLLPGRWPLQLVDRVHVRATDHRLVHLRISVRVDHRLISRVEVVRLVLPLIEELDAPRAISWFSRLLRLVQAVAIESGMLLLLRHTLLAFIAGATTDLLRQEEVVVLALSEVRVDIELSRHAEVHLLLLPGLRPGRIVQIQCLVRLFLSAGRPLPLLKLHVQCLSADRVVVTAGHRRQIVFLDLIDTVEPNRLVLVHLTVFAATHEIVRAEFHVLVSGAHFRVESRVTGRLLALLELYILFQ